jgi:hypothetical protein
MQDWKGLLSTSGLARISGIRAQSQKYDDLGFSTENKTPRKIRYRMISLISLYILFAESTRARSFCVKPGIPSGNSSLRSCLGAGAPCANKRLAMGRSLALLAVPQGGAECV